MWKNIFSCQILEAFCISNCILLANEVIHCSSEVNAFYEIKLISIRFVLFEALCLT